MKKFVYDSDLNVNACMLSDYPQYFPQHYHNYYTIGLNLKGTHSLTCCYDKTFTHHILGEDMFILLNPFEVHQGHGIDNLKTTYCSLSIPINVMYKYWNQPKEKNKYLLIFQKTTVTDEDLATKFLDFQYLFLENTTAFFNKNMQFDRIINEIVSKYTTIKTTAIASQNLVISSACNYITQNYHKNFTVEEMCKQLNIKISTLFFHFHKEFGITPQRYIMSMRIIAAKQLLKTSMPISNVALAVGFYDHSHFTNFFKRIEGITPLEYRHAFDF